MNEQKTNLMHQPHDYMSPRMQPAMSVPEWNDQPPQYFQMQQPQPPPQPQPQPQPQVVYVQAPALGRDPVPLPCPNCHQRIVTDVSDMATMSTHVLALVLGLLCGLCCIPYCVQSCQAQKHTCPLCRVVIGIYNK